jgi:hypothetical protein
MWAGNRRGDGAIPVTWDSYSYSISRETRESIGAFLDDLKTNGLIPVGSEMHGLH